MHADAIDAGGQVTLLPLLPEHVTERYVTWLNDPAVVAQTEQKGVVHTLDSVRAYVQSNVTSADALLYRIMVGDQHVGNIRLSALNRVHCRAIIALIVGEADMRGRGIGTAAIDLLAGHALDTMGLRKVTAGIYSTNPASRRSFEKAGFHLEAALRDHACIDGSFIDVWQMARFAAGAGLRTP